MVSIYKEAVKDALYPRKNGVVSKRNQSLSETPVRDMKAAEIKALRKSLRLSIAVFASLLSVSVKTLEAWEAGTNKPSGPSLRLMNMMKDNPDFLIDMGLIKESFR